MRVLFDGEPHVHYGQIYVHSSSDWFSDLGAAFAGQSNGLCGAAVPGALFLITGLHTGNVGFTVELHAAEPPVGGEWEEVVEASFRPAGLPVALVGWAGEASWPLDLPAGDLRGRYCGIGLDAGHATDTRMDGEPMVDRYLLQFWPAAPAPDRVLKQTGANAAYWHDFARHLRHPRHRRRPSRSPRPSGRPR
jgi:hypothetical protein